MWQPSSALRSSQNFLGPSIMVAATVDFKDWAPPHSYSPISYDTSVVQISFCQTSCSAFRILTSIRGCISCLQCQLSWCTFPALFKSCQSSIPTQAQQIVLRWFSDLYIYTNNWKIVEEGFNPILVHPNKLTSRISWQWQLTDPGVSKSSKNVFF